MANHVRAGRLSKWGRRHVLRYLLPLLAGSLLLAGCTRAFYRKRADTEVSEVLAEKDKYPKWAIDQFHVYPNPLARFADPTCPDRPPMPPDDPAAYCLSPNPQKSGKEGVTRVEGTGYLELLAKWDKENRDEAAAQKQREEAGDKSESRPGEQAGVAPQGGPNKQDKPNKPDKPDGEPQEEPPAPPRQNPPVPSAQEPPPPGGGGQVPVQPAPTPAENAAEPKSGGYTGAATPTTSLSSGPDAPRPYLLKLEQAVELGLINSREYQDAREDLYLTALPVTLERFGFAAQFFAAEQAIRERSGPQTPEGHRNDWTLNSNVGFAKLFSTGALLLVNFANQTVFNLTGTGRSLTSQSTINLDIVQPFLRGGGRAVTLEPLTQSERNLVYEIRNFARFREEFYVAIAGGGGGSITGSSFQPVGVIASSTFSPTGGVGGSSGLQPGMIPPVPFAGNPGLRVTEGSSGRIPLQTALAAPVSGYLTTLLEAAQMRVDAYNLEKLQGYLALAKAMEEGGDISKLQVDQFEQQVLLRRSTLLQDQLQYLQSLDKFKLQLGLPTPLPLELDDAPFRPLNRMFERYENLFREFEAAGRAPLAFAAAEAVGRVRDELRRLFTSSAIVRGTRFRNRIADSWGGWERLSADEVRKRLAGLREERRRLLDRKAELENKAQELGAEDQKRLNELDFEIDLGEFETVLREYEARPWQNVTNADLRRREQQAKFRYVVNAFILVLAEARTERILQLRGLWPDLARLCVNNVDLIKADFDEAENVVVQTALLNRLDLMNVRAEVVDAWRQLAVFANALLGTFNVAYHMDTSTPAGLAQPLLFSANRARQQLFFNLELPLVRMAERNNYRASLINYQRARRILQRAEDQVAFDVRGEIQLLRQQEEQYRIQQRQVELAYMTVENSLDTFQAPPAPVPPGAQPADTATRAAALTTQLINAQSSLYNAQFQMTTIWITYLNSRLDLYRDLELMPLDARGVWIDDVASCQCPDRDANRSGDRNQPGDATGGQRSTGGEGGRPERLPEPESVPPAPGPGAVPR